MFKRTAVIVGLALTFASQGFAQQPPAVSYERPVSWRYASEQEWIASDVASTMAALSGRGRSTLEAVRVRTLAPNGGVDRFEIEAGTEHTIIEIHDHVWSAANYAPLARKWIKTRSAQSDATSGLLSVLTTPKIEVIEAANRDLGHRLATGSSKTDHEDAALLVGTMAFREGLGQFSDVRHLLSLMTAHLAIAQSIPGPTTKNGQVAELVQLALIGRQRDVIDRLAKWEAASPSPLERTWIRALKLRATGDWRLLERPQQATLLERVEYARALEERLGAAAVLEFLDTGHPEDVVDWARIVEYSMNVEAGQRFSKAALVGELREAIYVWSKMSGQPAVTEEAVKDVLAQLNKDLSTDTGLTSALPIDWPTWVASFQRHLATDVVGAVTLESKSLGRPKNAREMAAEQERLFGGMPLFPFAKLRYALDDLQHADAMKDVVGLMLRRPETITSDNWLAGVDAYKGHVASGVTPQSVWFTTLVPVGTAYDAANRVYMYGRTNHLTMQSLHGVRQVAPYARYLLEEEMRWRYRAPRTAPFVEYRTEAGPLVDYDYLVIQDVLEAAKQSPAEYVPLAQRLCHIRAESCASLGQYLADRDRDEEAVRAYQYFVEKARDQVAVSTGASWLITFYYTHGQQARARELAERVAMVYSYSGLKAKAAVLERDRNYQEAEATLKRALERYESRGTSDLAAFYVRWNTAWADPGVKSAGDALVAKVFPQGLEHVDAAALTEPPQDGGRLTSIGDRGARAGFAIGDIIIAIDGIRVHTYDQLYLAWNMAAAPEISFVVWKDSKYVTIHGPLRESWNTWNVNNYQKTPAAR